MTASLDLIDDEDGLETLSQCASALSCSIRQVYYLDDAGELTIVHSGRSARVVTKSRKDYVRRLVAREAERRAARLAASENPKAATPPGTKAGRYIKGYRYPPA